MSVHLVGGGWRQDYAGEVYREFLTESAAQALRSGRSTPRIGVLLVSEDDSSSSVARYRDQLARVAPCEPIITEIREGELFDSAVLTDLDGLLVGGGHTPSYLAAMAPISEEIRFLVGAELPYLGFSAGAAIAAAAALVGGWRIGGLEVCAEEASEDLDQLTVAAGLGLIDLAIEVHAAQWGTLSRLIAAVESGLVEGGIAIDEFTALVVGDGDRHVVGGGSVWQVARCEDAVLVSTLAA